MTRWVMILVVVIAGCCGGEMAPMPADAGPAVYSVGDAGLVSICEQCAVRCAGEDLLTPGCEPLEGQPADVCDGCLPSCFVTDRDRRATLNPIECPGFPERTPTECPVGIPACTRFL